MMAQELEPIPDYPEFEKSLFEQAEEMLLEINVREKPSSASKLYVWTMKHPGPEATAAASMAVKLFLREISGEGMNNIDNREKTDVDSSLRDEHDGVDSNLTSTKVQGCPPERRLSLLYAIHELFRRASKDLERDFDYAAWKDAVRAVVPWAYRKQNEVDQMKINKSVLKTWANSGWLSKDFVDSLIPGRGTPKKTTANPLSRASSPVTSGSSSSGGGRDSVRRRRPGVGGSGGGSGGASAAKRQRTASSMTAKSDTNSGGNNVEGDLERAQGSSAPHAIDFSSAGYSPVGISGGSSSSTSGTAASVGSVQLPIPSAEQLAEAVEDLAAAGAAVAAASNRAGGSGTGDGEGGVNTITPSPEGNHADGTVADAGGSGESPQELQKKALSLKLDGCGLIRRIGKAMRFPVRVMLTAFHLFHHYQWCGSVASFKFPPGKLPAVCLACLLAATKAEDCNAKLETLLQQMRQLEPILPPLEGIFPLGQRPSSKEVVDFEYKVLLSRGFDLEMMHPTEHVSTLLALTGAPVQVGELAYEVLCSRVYTDSTLCLEEDPITCLCAAMQFSLLSPLPQYVKPIEGVSPSSVEDWPMLYGATKADLLSFTERLVQRARDLADIAPGQTFMIPRGGADADHHHHYTHAQPVLRSSVSTGNGGGSGGSFAGTIKKTSPHASGKTPDRMRKRGNAGGGNGGSGGGHSRNTPPPAVVSSSTPVSRSKASTPSSSARPVVAVGAGEAVKSAVPVTAAIPATAAVKATVTAPATAAVPSKAVAVKATPAAPTAVAATLTATDEAEKGKERSTASTAQKEQQSQPSQLQSQQQKQQQKTPSQQLKQKKAANTLADMDMDVDSSPEKAGVDGILTLQQGLRKELERQRRAAEERQAPGGHGDGSSSAVDHGITGAAPGDGHGSVRGNGRGSVAPGADGVGAGAVPSDAPPIAQALPNPSHISHHHQPHQPAHKPGVVDPSHPKVSQTSHNPPPQNLGPGPGPPGLAPSGQHLLPPPQVPAQQLQQQQVDPGRSSVLPHPRPSLLSESIAPPVQHQQHQPQHPPPIHQQQLQQHHGHLQPPPAQPGHYQPPRPPPPQLQPEQLQQVQRQQQQQSQQLLSQQPPPPLEQHPGPGFSGVGFLPSNPPVSSSPPVPPLLDIPQPQYQHQPLHEQQRPYQHAHAQSAFPLQDTENSAAGNSAANNVCGSGNGSGSGSGSGMSSVIREGIGGNFQGPIHEPQYYRGAEHSGRSSAGSASAPDGGGIGGVGPFHEEEGVPYRQSPEPEYPGGSSRGDSVLSELRNNGQPVAAERGDHQGHALAPMPLRLQEAHQQPPHFQHDAQQQQHLTPHGEVHSGDASGIPLPPEQQEQRLKQGDAYGLGREPSVGGLQTTTHRSNVEAGDGQQAGPWQQQQQQQQQMGTGAWGPGPGGSGVTGMQIDDHEGGTVGPVRRDGAAEVQGEASYLEEVLAPPPVVGQQTVPGSLGHDGGWERGRVDPEGWLP